MRRFAHGVAVAAATFLPGTALSGGVSGAPPLAQPVTSLSSPQCWTAAELAAHPEERRAHKGVFAFDKPPPTGDSAERAAGGPVPPLLQGSIRRVALNGKRKLLALTFDLCEQAGEVAGYDGAIIDYLRSRRVRATFFAGGKWLLSHRGRALQLLADPLFEVGTHGFAHRNVRGLNSTALKIELFTPLHIVAALRQELAERRCLAGSGTAAASRPAPPALFRFPYGACNPVALKAVNDAGLLAIQWNISTGDPSPAQSAAGIAAQMIRLAAPGSIILAHANGRGVHTAEALPLAIPRLRAAGYEFVTVSELLAAGRPQAASACYDARPGDVDRYDRLLLPRVARTPARVHGRIPVSPGSPMGHRPHVRQPVNPPS